MYFKMVYILRKINKNMTFLTCHDLTLPQLEQTFPSKNMGQTSSIERKRK